MLRSDINSHIAENMGETFGTTGEASKDFAYQKLVTQACDEIARRTRCFWKTSYMPIVANQPQYCAPQVIEYQALTLFTADGALHQMDTATTPGMDDWGGSTWRSQSASSQPSVVIAQGLSGIVLSPPPSYNSNVYSYIDLVLGAGGLTVSSALRPFVNAPAPAGDVGLSINVIGGTGFTAGWYPVVSVAGGIATLATSAGVAGSIAGLGTLSSGGLWIEGPGVPGETWESKASPCPLPDRTHMAVVWQACCWRCIRDPSDKNALRMKWLKDELMEAVGALEKETFRVTQASRIPAMIGNGGYQSGAWDSTYGSPLNM
jgi:hypothetical protein